jgi:hypothetical protein
LAIEGGMSAVGGARCVATRRVGLMRWGAIAGGELGDGYTGGFGDGLLLLRVETVVVAMGVVSSIGA